MSTGLPIPGRIVIVRQQRWQVNRVQRLGAVTRFDVSNAVRAMTFLAPFDRPVVAGVRRRPSRVRPQQAAARLAGLIGTAVSHRSLMTAVGAVVDILPYQLEPALAVLSGRRRVLVADEVGLGKTVQAGLLIGEVLRREPAARVLVLAPASIREQWAAELGRRFGVSARMADQTRLDRLAATGPFGDNPWSRAGTWIASLDFVKQPHVLDGLPAMPWDLLVVDEAHDACGDSSRHAGCLRLARQSRRVLLLTATPHSGDPVRFSRLTDLGRLQGVADELVVFSRTRAGLGLPTSRRVRWHRVTLSTVELRLLDTLTAFERTVLDHTSDRATSALLLSVFRKRALSTSQALRRSLARRLTWLDGRDGGRGPAWRQTALPFDEDELPAADAAGLQADSGLSPRAERSWLRRLCSLADATMRTDSKLRRLHGLLSRSAEPVVIFTEFRDSLDAIVHRCGRVRPLSILHGGMTPAESRRALRRFQSGDTTALVATDVAAQGLNLHDRARWVVSFELPWTPVRIEQRAGRVDRIGQRRPVHVSLIVARHEAEEGLLARLARRVLTARRALGLGTLGLFGADEAAVRADLLEGVPSEGARPEVAVGPAVRVAAQWDRPARAAARALAVRRLLAGRWRAPAPCPTAAVWCGSRRLPRLGAGTGRPVFVFLVPILDQRGGVVEQCPVAVCPGLAGERSERPPAAERARVAAAAHVRARVRRLARLLARQAGPAIDLERALARRLTSRSPGAAQAGLFDSRDLRLADSLRTASADVEAALRERIDRIRFGSQLRPGHPVLVLRIDEDA